MGLEKQKTDSQTASLPSLVREARKDRSYLIWTGLIPLSMMLLLYVIDQVFPFGENSVLVLDLNAQYIGFYEALRAFLYGDGSLLYSFTRALGGEMMGIYAYYIASPFSYLVALFPQEYITEALLCIFVIKTGLAGFTFGWYLDRHQYARPRETVMFSTLYALCSFAIVMQNNSMWMDSLVWLPLLTLGIEKLIKYRRFELYVVALSLSLLSNFYMGYMLCLYVLLYFLYYFYAYNRHHENNPLREKQHYGRSLVRMAFYSLLAIGISAVILMTVLYSLSLGKNTFTDPDFTPYLQFDPLAFFSKLLPGVYDTVEPEGLPFVYCGTLTLLLVPLYFLNRRFSRSERISTGVLLCLFYLSMSVSSLDMLWHGGQAPNWLNYRYSFFVCFLLLVTAARAFRRLSDCRGRSIGGTAILLLAGIAIVYAMRYEYLPDWVTGMAAVFVVVLTLLLLAIRRYGRSFWVTLLLLVVLSETFYNGSIQISGLHANIGGTDRAEYRDYMDRMQPLIAYVKEQDDGFYRMETTRHRGLNDAMGLQYYGVTHSTSTLDAKTIEFLHRMGLLAKDQWSRYEGSTIVLDSLLGIRYFATTLTSAPHARYERQEDAPAFVYKNPYALPIAYAANQKINDLMLGEIDEPTERQNALLGSILGQDPAAVYTAIKPTEEYYDHVEVGYIEDRDGTAYTELLSHYYVENRDQIDADPFSAQWEAPADTGMTWEITVPRDGALYFYIPTDYPQALSIHVNGGDAGLLFGDEDDYLHHLGDFQAGETVTVSVRFAEQTLYFYYKTGTNFFYQEDTDLAISYLEEIAKGGLTVTKHSDDRISGKITTTEAQSVVLTTIPYDAGWQITVDGKSVTPYKTLDALLAFDVEPGEHTVSMVYRPASFHAGMTLSLISFGLFVLLLLLDGLWRRGIGRPKAGGSADRIFSIFFYYENDRLPPEPNYLGDAYMPLPSPRTHQDTPKHAEGESADGT